MTNVKETKIERMLEEARDGDLVELILKENTLPRVMEHFARGDYIRTVIALGRASTRPAYGMGESSLVRSVIGYYGQWFGKEGDIAKQQVILYPMCQEVLAMNSCPPIRIEIPLTGIESYEIIKKGEKPVTPPSGFP